MPRHGAPYLTRTVGASHLGGACPCIRCRVTYTAACLRCRADAIWRTQRDGEATVTSWTCTCDAQEGAA